KNGLWRIGHRPLINHWEEGGLYDRASLWIGIGRSDLDRDSFGRIRISAGRVSVQWRSYRRECARLRRASVFNWRFAERRSNRRSAVDVRLWPTSVRLQRRGNAPTTGSGLRSDAVSIRHRRSVFLESGWRAWLPRVRRRGDPARRDRSSAGGSRRDQAS